MITLTTRIEAQPDGTLLLLCTSNLKDAQPNEKELKQIVLEAIKYGITINADPSERTTFVEGDENYARKVLAKMKGQSGYE